MSEQQNDQNSLSHRTISFNSSESSAIQTMVEGLVDRAWILSERGEWTQATDYAHELCQQLCQELSPDAVPQEIWQLCQALIESCDLFPNQQLVRESESSMNSSTKLHLRACWLQLADCVSRARRSLAIAPRNRSPYLLVTLEDCHPSDPHQMLNQIDRQGLTPREADVWLLYCFGYSYGAIASQLQISGTTVKKHIKTIYRKCLWANVYW
jgi:DNA-binding CsgD family transcriptional regulator